MTDSLEQPSPLRVVPKQASNQIIDPKTHHYLYEYFIVEDITLRGFSGQRIETVKWTIYE